MGVMVCLNIGVSEKKILGFREGIYTIVCNPDRPRYICFFHPEFVGLGEAKDPSCVVVRKMYQIKSIQSIPNLKGVLMKSEYTFIYAFPVQRIHWNSLQFITFHQIHEMP